MQAFADLHAAVAAQTEALLDRLLSPEVRPGETLRPDRLLGAMRHAALGGGKRLRPLLVVASADLFGVPRERALMAGAALEGLHCYSLVHDDLPAMDDDDLRRGRPTIHRAYDEATAILAGDALLTLAFDILSRPEVHPDAAVRVRLIAELARAAGLGGMAGGQMLDLAAEGRFGGRRNPDEAGVATLQAMKTGALIRYACRAGAILGGADVGALDALSAYGEALGRAFQIADDLLDAEGSAETLGKAVNKDAAAGKATFVALYGVAGAKAKLAEAAAAAEAALAPFESRAGHLAAILRFTVDRRM